MKRFAAVTLLALALALAACDGGGPGPGTPTGPAPTSDTPTPTPGTPSGPAPAPGTPTPIGTLLGEQRYVVGIENWPDTPDAVHTGDQIDELRHALAGVEEVTFLPALDVDPATTANVTIDYDGCYQHGSILMTDGVELTLDFETVDTTTCVRAVDTVAFFAVDLADLPDPVLFADIF